MTPGARRRWFRRRFVSDGDRHPTLAGAHAGAAVPCARRRRCAHWRRPSRAAAGAVRSDPSCNRRRCTALRRRDGVCAAHRGSSHLGKGGSCEPGSGTGRVLRREKVVQPPQHLTASVSRARKSRDFSRPFHRHGHSGLAPGATSSHFRRAYGQPAPDAGAPIECHKPDGA